MGLQDIVADAKALLGVAEPTSAAAMSGNMLALAKFCLRTDSYHVTLCSRLRAMARQHRVPLVNHALRVMQTAVYGIELGNEVELGHGVWFIHPLGIVIGGNARIGNRVRFFGNNTVGTAKENGYPVIEDDVWVGAGARILGPIRIGARSVIGANAVVLRDVPADSVATGLPATHRPKNPELAALRAGTSI